MKQRKHKQRLAVDLLIAIVAFYFSAGCEKKHDIQRQSAQPLPAAKVKAILASAKDRQAFETVVGTVRSKTRAVIEAKVSGRIESLLAVPGQTVKAGELLAKLDAREIQAKVEQAKALYEQASSDLKRYTSLYESKTVTLAEYEARVAQFKVAEANLKEAQTMLGYVEVTAPFDGVITRKIADVGDLAYPGKPILEIEDPKYLRFEANVPEALYDKVKLNEKFSIFIPTIAGEIQGTVSEIAPVADPNTRTFLVKLDLPEHKGLRTGQFGRLKIPTSQSAALRVPISGIVVRGQMEIAFVVETNLARMRLVKTGDRVGNEIEVLSGIEPHEKVIVTDVAQLRDGQPVVVE
ncbi:MAG: efflux RND transporter periplasmic adaptor subunit [Verrucomicrobiae bacterium]|nr:efflux RND transporter periplasmic adaptor subunit [Verrucomicrobiae bacterium]